MPAADVVILSAARTPIGRYGGSFQDLHPAELGAVASRAAIERTGIAPADIDVLMGQGRQAGSGPNPAHQVGHRAGVPNAAPAQTINKACASGLQALVSGAQTILLGESRIVLAGGIESMSRDGFQCARIVVTLLHELERRNARLGLATLCVSGGMGMAVAIERCA